ncbi:MAG: hypothetical protein WBV69_23100, partial [Candidatus Sulfotelmatobacter sp.]
NRRQCTAAEFFMTNTNTVPSIDEYLRERLMPVEGAIPHIPALATGKSEFMSIPSTWRPSPAFHN